MDNNSTIASDPSDEEPGGCPGILSRIPFAFLDSSITALPASHSQLFAKAAFDSPLGATPVKATEHLDINVCGVVAGGGGFFPDAY